MENKTEISKFYQTHCNGSRPFQVEIKSNLIKIRRIKDVDYDELTEEELDKGADEDCVYENVVLVIANPLKVFIGKDICVPRHAPKDWGLGNSILVQISKEEYIYIGDCIYSFFPKYPIVKYYSQIGNSNVPYPLALDTSGRIYLMCDNVSIVFDPNSENEDVFQEGHISDYDAPYLLYYDNEKNTQWKKQHQVEDMNVEKIQERPD